MEDDRSKTLVERVVDATNEKVNRVQSEVTSVVSATGDRASAVREKAQQAGSRLPLATRDDVARLQERLDRIEAALADLTKKERKPAARRTTKPKPAAPAPTPDPAPTPE